MIQEMISNVLSGMNLTREDSAGVMQEIMGGEATDAQIAAFLVGLRCKGETVEEIAGAAQVMREKATRIQTKHKVVVDTCGTGGDGSGTFNISTTAAFVVAGADICVAKHGNRSVSSQCGSADVLKALGVNIEISPEQVGRCLDEVGIGFLFAPMLHGAMKYAIGPRREIGVRTIFNVLGPLTNPAGASHQLIGVYSRALTSVIAEVLHSLGAERAMVVHGSDGLDEITVTGESYMSILVDGEVWSSKLSPEEVGISLADPKTLLGGTAQENAEITLSILSGKEQGPKRDVVLLNAAAALSVGARVPNFEQGVEMAREVLDSGAALGKLEMLKEASNA
ncbi:MAG: anthranilate phosphoribosyltransferase [Candidatus Latescibacterota bacterium]